MMIIAAQYSFKGGHEVVTEKYPNLLAELEAAIDAVHAEDHKDKISEEITMTGKHLYSPIGLNEAFKEFLNQRGWAPHKEQCDYSDAYYTRGYRPPEGQFRNATREMDFVKERLGVEVQFGKYAFMVYNVAAKMTIFHNLGIIDTGVEIVPVRELTKDMSTGVSYFEQFIWDLEKRGSADIDIPVLILGVASEKSAIADGKAQ